MTPLNIEKIRIIAILIISFTIIGCETVTQSKSEMDLNHSNRDFHTLDDISPSPKYGNSNNYSLAENIVSSFDDIIDALYLEISYEMLDQIPQQIYIKLPDILRFENYFPKDKAKKILIDYYAKKYPIMTSLL